MAAYTSSQNGNFSDSSTWGGNTPADGDTFTINHTVTLTGTNEPTNGYGDIRVANNGTLTNADNATLRMNGNIRVETTSSSAPAIVHFKNNFTCEWNGANGDNHGFQVDNSAGSHCFIEGNDPSGLVTTTTAATDGNVCTHSVSDGSLFSAGDWIQVYSYNYTSTSQENDALRFDDEGFWIHEVSGNTLYTRDYVGPEDVTISAVNSTIITVTNSKVFRKGMQVIFGTGSNRNIRTISAINYTTHKLTLDSAVTGTVTGETVYRAMSLKPHPSGSKVRKMATTTTAESSSGATTITVGSTSGMSVGSRLFIERRSEASSSTDYAAATTKEYDYVISSISNNTVTLTTTLNYRVVEGALVSVLDRSIKFRTVATDGSDFAHLYVEHRSGYDRYLVLKDIEFDNWGDNDNNVRTGVVIRGLNKVNDASTPVTLVNTIPQQHRGSWVEGLTITHYPGHETDWGSLWLYDCRSAVARCCTTLYGDDGIAVYYEPYCGALGNLSVGQRSHGMRVEGQSELNECAYNYVSRSNNRFRSFNYDEGIGGNMHNCIVNATDYASCGWYSMHPGNVWRCKFTGIRYGTLSESPMETNGGFLDCYIETLSGYQTLGADGFPTDSNQAGQYRQSHYNRGGSSAALRSIEHNFEYDQMRVYGYYWEAYWNDTENAWHFLRYKSGDNNPSMGETVYIPANATGRFTVKCKGVSGFSGTRPYAFALDTKSSFSENNLGFTATTNRPLRGKRYNTQFTSAFDSAYEEVQITIDPEPFSRYYKIGVRSSNRNATEGFFIKDFNFYLDTSVNERQFMQGNVGSVNVNAQSSFRKSFTQQKKRIGGRLK